jgi:2',3'-cyclic-nucleotide 2'-phosphodiesterase (5'-nucleotidase family)
VLDNLALQSDADHVLLINTGNDFRPGAEPEKRRAAIMFKAFSLMGVDCLALSEREFVFGTAFLRELAAKSSVPLVCGNLKDTKAQGAYFMPYLRLKRAGKTILVTAVVDPAKASSLAPGGLEVDDPVASLRRLQRHISHDFFIVVMQTNKATAEKWLSKVSGVEIVILGQQKGVQVKAEKLHGAQLLYNCRRGQTVSVVEVPLAKAG